MGAYFDPDEFRRMRVACCMSQRDVAEIAGVSQVMVSHVEIGRRSPSRRTAIDLAYALGCTVYGIGGVDTDDPDEEMDRWDALERLLCVAQAKRRIEEGVCFRLEEILAGKNLRE